MEDDSGPPWPRWNHRLPTQAADGSKAFAPILPQGPGGVGVGRKAGAGTLPREDPPSVRICKSGSSLSQAGHQPQDLGQVALALCASVRASGK